MKITVKQFVDNVETETFTFSEHDLFLDFIHDQTVDIPSEINTVDFQVHIDNN